LTLLDVGYMALDYQTISGSNVLTKILDIYCVNSRMTAVVVIRTLRRILPHNVILEFATQISRILGSAVIKQCAH
ncbi:hypothetical protein, partial [Vibrio breoganii]|uniref:hypothetical protein n=1 Tax=Vibrio breoganii TaxID=553239 RepID=UPI001A7E049D